MSNNFFELSSPHDMVEKAKRELERMGEDLSIDSIFNFFVTAYHVMDYIKQQGIASQVAIDSMYRDPDFELCQFICNKGKHLALNKGDRDTKSVHQPGAVIGASMIGSLMVGEYPSDKFYIDGKEVDLVNLAGRLITKWETFFANNGI